MLPHHYSATGGKSVALPLTPTNMSLPAASAQVALKEPVLPPELVAYLQEPNVFTRQDIDASVFKPAPHFVHCRDWPGIAAKLVNCGLARITKDEDEPRFDRWHLRTGVFGVPKSEGDLVRLIIDRRRANLVEHSMRHLVIHDERLTKDRKAELLRFMTLPHSSQYTDLVIPFKGEVRVSLEDARDFFYLLQMPEARVRETMIGWPVNCSELFERLGMEVPAAWRGEKRVSLQLLSPAMGDQKSVDVVQASHTHTVHALRALSPPQWMSFGFAPPGTGQWQGAYVDDYSQVTLLPGQSSVPGYTNELQLERDACSRKRVYAAYDRVQFQRKKSKSVVLASTAVVWGGEIDSTRRDVGGSLAKVKPLVRLTMGLLKKSLVSRKQLQRIVGFWTHHLMYRRCGLALFDKIYAFMRHGRGRRLRWTAPVKDELYLVCVLWPLLRSSLSAHLSDTLIATDATLEYGGVCAAQLSVEEAVWCWYRCPRRAGAVRWSSLDPLDEYEVESVAVPDVFMEAFVGSKHFKLLKKYRLKVRHHINVQEGIAWRTAVKMLTQWPRFDGSRVVFIVDSLVLQSVITRGRSRSRRLNQVALAAAASLLFADVYPLMSWVRTEHNPADDPTRHADLRMGKPLPVEKSVNSIGEYCPWVLAATQSMWADLGWMERVSCAAANPVESRLFDSTRGFPGEGPAGRRRLRPETCPERTYEYEWTQWRIRPLCAFKDLQKEEVRVINKVLGTYVQYLHAMGRPTQWGTDTLAGAQFAVPSLQGNLKEVWSIQRQWCRITPMTTRTPLPLDVLLAMCVVC
eukprot:4084265-Amphidinium_carterae.1